MTYNSFFLYLLDSFPILISIFFHIPFEIQTLELNFHIPFKIQSLELEINGKERGTRGYFQWQCKQQNKSKDKT
jgi:hypothetical protein